MAHDNPQWFQINLTKTEKVILPKIRRHIMSRNSFGQFPLANSTVYLGMSLNDQTICKQGVVQCDICATLKAHQSPFSALLDI